MSAESPRVQAVFRKAVEAANPALRAAILDLECGSDTELRRRVEALLQALQAPPGPPPAAPPLPEEGTLVFDLQAAPKEPSRATYRPDRAPGRVAPNDEGPPALEFLQPTARPESLGRLGHYEVLEVLGRGSFGIVVRAFDEMLQRVVAIKVLSPELATTSPARKRFLREARAAARVRHENVVQIHAVEEQPLPYLVMEYIPGQTLQEKLDQTGPLETPDVVRIGEQIARGLAAAHEQGLIHRDIKPGNILLESLLGQKVKITDFGLARAADDASVSQSGVIAGTPLYMAPEQANGDALDHRADLFSLGSVLYAMVSGRPPFRAGTALAVLKRVAEDAPRPIREIIPEAPPWLCDLIARLHAKDPARRFPSAAAVADALSRGLSRPRQPAAEPRTETVQAPRPRPSRRTALLAAAVVLVVLGVLGATLTYPLWRPSSPGDGGGRPSQPDAPERPGAPRSLALQGRPAVRDALIEFNEPERSFGGVDRDNAVRRAEKCNAFLVHFDLSKLDAGPKARVEKATLSFYVWDPSSRGKTRVCAFALKTAWDEATATWRRPAAGQSWRGGDGFAFGADTGPPGPGVIVLPDQEGTDTVDPPIEYQLDVTDPVRAWLTDGAPNHGLAIAPVIDPSVDEGTMTRFQMYGSEYSRAQYTPKLTVQLRP
jgi:serine/threonine protein kinase